MSYKFTSRMILFIVALNAIFLIATGHIAYGAVTVLGLVCFGIVYAVENNYTKD